MWCIQVSVYMHVQMHAQQHEINKVMGCMVMACIRTANFCMQTLLDYVSMLPRVHSTLILCELG